jgi:hypothetical protein
MRLCMEYLVLNRKIGLAERKILAMVYISCFKDPSVLRLPDSC